MKAAKQIERLVGNFCAANKSYTSTSSEMDKRVLTDALSAYKKSTTSKPAWAETNIRRIIMKSPITKLAAAAVIIVAVVLSINVWDKSMPSAYGIEQTIEANNSVRYLHIRNFTAGKDEPREGWLEFRQDGQVAKLRAYMPEWASPEEGPRVIVWKDNIVQVWLKRKNVLGIMKEQMAKDQLTDLLQDYDPRLAIRRIYELHAQGKVQVEINDPADKTEPIKVTVTYLPESSTPQKRKILFINPTTKLVNTVELYQLKNDQYQYEGVIELDEYNQAIDTTLFDLRDEAPSNVKLFDQASDEVGLAQGQLSDEEIAIEVVRQLFEALIAEDYNKAGKLFILTIPADQIQKQFSQVKFIGIVSIGPAVRNPDLENKGFNVNCTIQIQENGKTKQLILKGIRVQHLHNQPERWVVASLD